MRCGQMESERDELISQQCVKEGLLVKGRVSYWGKYVDKKYRIESLLVEDFRKECRYLSKYSKYG